METEAMTEKELLPYPFGSPRDVLTALFRQKKIIFWIFIVTLIGAAGWIYSKPTLFAAKTTLVLKFGREHIFRPEIGQVNQIVQFDQEAAIESERKIIESRDLVRRVVKDMGAEYLYPKVINPSKKRNPQNGNRARHIKVFGKTEVRF